MARCPAHDDRGPSLSVAEAEDRVLVHCFAGCTTEDVCAAVELQLSDLFSEHTPQERHASGLTATERLELLQNEAYIVALVALEMKAGRKVSEQDWQRLSQAVLRINAI